MHIKSITIRGFKSYKDEGACALFSRNAQKKKKKVTDNAKNRFFFRVFFFFLARDAQCAWTTFRTSTTQSVSRVPAQRCRREPH